MKAYNPKVSLAWATDYIQRLDMAVLLVLHKEFGFGPARLRRFYQEILPMVEEFEFYNGRHEQDFGKRKDGMMRMDMELMKQKLMEIGFDYDTVVNEVKANADGRK